MIDRYGKMLGSCDTGLDPQLRSIHDVVQEAYVLLSDEINSFNDYNLDRIWHLLGAIADSDKSWRELHSRSYLRLGTKCRTCKGRGEVWTDGSLWVCDNCDGQGVTHES